MPLTPEEAKRKVLEHWQWLDALTRRHFPKDENLAHEWLDYVMNKLQADEWRRVCVWRGLGRFSSFLATLTGRLLTDFIRARVGHSRPPAWLDEKRDSLWDTAYRLLAVEHCAAHEAVEWLLCGYPERERWFIEEVVSTIRKRCRRETQAMQYSTSMETEFDVTDESPAPDRQLMIEEDEEMSEALQAYLHGDAEAPISQRVSELLSRLREHLHLSEEDRLLLRLRFQDGLSIPAIARLLHLQGDLYKRMNKLIAELRRACQRVAFYLE